MSELLIAVTNILFSTAEQKLNTLILLTAARMPTTIRKKRTVAISWQQWVSEPATILSCKHFAYLFCLLVALFTLITLTV